MAFQHKHPASEYATIIAFHTCTVSHYFTKSDLILIWNISYDLISLQYKNKCFVELNWILLSLFGYFWYWNQGFLKSAYRTVARKPEETCEEKMKKCSVLGMRGKPLNCILGKTHGIRQGLKTQSTCRPWWDSNPGHIGGRWGKYHKANLHTSWT